MLECSINTPEIKVLLSVVSVWCNGFVLNIKLLKRLCVCIFADSQQFKLMTG